MGWGLIHAWKPRGKPGPGASPQRAHGDKSSLCGGDSHVLDGISVSGYSRSGRVDDKIVSGDRENPLIVGIGQRKGKSPSKWTTVTPACRYGRHHCAGL